MPGSEAYEPKYESDQHFHRWAGRSHGGVVGRTAVGDHIPLRYRATAAPSTNALGRCDGRGRSTAWQVTAATWRAFLGYEGGRCLRSPLNQPGRTGIGLGTELPTVRFR